MCPSAGRLVPPLRRHGSPTRPGVATPHPRNEKACARRSLRRLQGGGRIHQRCPACLEKRARTACLCLWRSAPAACWPAAPTEIGIRWKCTECSDSCPKRHAVQDSFSMSCTRPLHFRTLSLPLVILAFCGACSGDGTPPPKGPTPVEDLPIPDNYVGPIDPEWPPSPGGPRGGASRWPPPSGAPGPGGTGQPCRATGRRVA